MTWKRQSLVKNTACSISDTTLRPTALVTKRKGSFAQPLGIFPFNTTLKSSNEKIKTKSYKQIMNVRLHQAWTFSKRILGAVRNGSERLWIPTKFVIWQSTHDPVELLLNEPDASKRRKRTRLWRESKISELTTAAYTVRYTAQQQFHLSMSIFDDTAVGAYGQCGSWSIFLDLYPQRPMDHSRRLVQQSSHGARLYHYVHTAEHSSA